MAIMLMGVLIVCRRRSLLWRVLVRPMGNLFQLQISDSRSFYFSQNMNVYSIPKTSGV